MMSLRANGAISFSNQVGGIVTSSSVATAISPVLAVKPALRAYASPLRGSLTSTTSGNSASTGAVSPDDGLLSTTTSSTRRDDSCSLSKRKHLRRSSGRSYVATTTETVTSSGSLEGITSAA